MKLKIILLLLLIAINLIQGQYINCTFSGNYQCGLVLSNSQGFDNFTSIGGNHLENRTNAEVTTITRSSGTSLNFPSIICETFPNALIINVNSARIEIVTEKSFANCTKATRIDLGSNRISTVPVNLLINNRELQIFRLISNNLIPPLPVGLFDSSPKITYFCHGTNPTEILLPEIFRGLSQMQTLHIFHLRVTEFPNCLLKPMINLVSLSASGSPLRVLHQKSFPPTKNRLTTINFSGSAIEAIDRKVFDNTSVLSTVNLNGNICINRSFSNFNANRATNLIALEPCFAEYDRRFPTDDSGSTCNFITHSVYGYTCELINFNVSAAIINNHPDCLSNSDVTGVIFTDTKISEIPPEIFSSFKNLMYIQANNVGLESALIQNCTQTLVYIDVSHNSIRNLPSNAFNCENLETIIVDDNCISSVQPCEMTFVENLSSLKTLSMKKTLCVDKEFDLDEITIEEIEQDMRKCFKMWYMM